MDANRLQKVEGKFKSCVTNVKDLTGLTNMFKNKTETDLLNITGLTFNELMEIYQMYPDKKGQPYLEFMQAMITSVWSSGKLPDCGDVSRRESDTHRYSSADSGQSSFSFATEGRRATDSARTAAPPPTFVDTESPLARAYKGLRLQKVSIMDMKITALKNFCQLYNLNEVVRVNVPDGKALSNYRATDSDVAALRNLLQRIHDGDSTIRAGSAVDIQSVVDELSNFKGPELVNLRGIGKLRNFCKKHNLSEDFKRRMKFSLSDTKNVKEDTLKAYLESLVQESRSSHRF